MSYVVKHAGLNFLVESGCRYGTSSPLREPSTATHSDFPLRTGERLEPRFHELRAADHLQAVHITRVAPEQNFVVSDTCRDEKMLGPEHPDTRCTLRILAGMIVSVPIVRTALGRGRAS
jgi:hypothetical protein